MFPDENFENWLKLLERCALLVSVQFSLMILINEKINGQARERILIAAFRWLSDIDSKQFEQSCIIFQASEEQSAGLKIADFISRLKIKPAFLRRIVQMIIRRDLFKALGHKRNSSAFGRRTFPWIHIKDWASFGKQTQTDFIFDFVRSTGYFERRRNANKENCWALWRFCCNREFVHRRSALSSKLLERISRGEACPWDDRNRATGS